MTLIKNENKPSVARFKGKLIMVRIGRINMKRSVKIKPPRSNVGNPPITFTPDKRKGRMKRESV
jgi:hypothetical protein